MIGMFWGSSHTSKPSKVFGSLGIIRSRSTAKRKKRPSWMLSAADPDFATSWYPVSVLTQEAFIFLLFRNPYPDAQWDWCVYLHLPQNYPNVGKYTIHGTYGYGFLHEFGKYSTYLTALVYLAQHVYPLVN